MLAFNELPKINENKAEDGPTTKVVVDIFRHSLKENNPNKTNAEILLSSDGRELARERGKDFHVQPEVALAGASLLDRTAETALLAMLNEQEKIKTDDSLEVMEAKIKEEIPLGKKMYRDKRLGFVLNKNEAGKAGYESFYGGRFLNWLVQDSDRQVLECEDKETTSYLRQAGNIAELVERYQKVGNNFNRLASKTDEYQKYGNQLERYLSSHQAVPESFIAKVLEIQESLAVRDEFADKLGNGWKETEGIHFEIINSQGSQKIIATYNDAEGKKEILIKPETIKQIIGERKEFEKKF